MRTGIAMPFGNVTLYNQEDCTEKKHKRNSNMTKSTLESDFFTKKHLKRYQSMN